jgi:hypothetical protein
MEADVPVVLDASGTALPGRSTLLDGESVWTFTPDAAWNPGRYILALPPGLEDTAGNTIAAPFEASSSSPSPRSDAPILLWVTVR